jgi:pimeloyl-ACP methyl ester carboxylesterase
MITDFQLPVVSEQVISVTYQKPGDSGDRPLAVMMHGFPGGHKAGCDDIFGLLESKWEEWGYPSVRFDFRGGGNSDGSSGDFTLETALEDLSAVMRWAREEAGHKDFILVGESLGGTVAIMGHDPACVKALILLWPAIVLQETSFQEMFTREARLANDKRDAPFVTFKGYRLSTHFYNEIYKTDLTTWLEKITVPVLIEHGTADTDVPLAQAYIARDHLKGLVNIDIFDGGDHGLRAPNRRKTMVANIRYFLDRSFKKLDLKG